MQCDITKYFPSIDHEILKQQLQRKIKCPDTLWLLDCIIDSSNPQETVQHYFPGDETSTGVAEASYSSGYWAKKSGQRFLRFIHLY